MQLASSCWFAALLFLHLTVEAQKRNSIAEALPTLFCYYRISVSVMFINSCILSFSSSLSSSQCLVFFFARAHALDKAGG